MILIQIFLAILCVELACVIGHFSGLRADFKRSRIHIEEIVKNQSGVDPDEPQITEEQEKAEQMMLDGINNIFSYDIGVALGGEGK